MTSAGCCCCIPITKRNHHSSPSSITTNNSDSHNGALEHTKSLWLSAKSNRIHRGESITMTTTREVFYTCSEDDLEKIKVLVKTETVTINYEDLLQLPPPEKWFNQGPLLVRVETYARFCNSLKILNNGEISAHNLPFNTNKVIEFETELFVGKAVFKFRNCPNENLEYFRGKKRRLQWLIQGRFKKPISTHLALTGFEFKSPAVNIPAKIVVKSVLRMMKTIAPTMRENLFGEKPYFLNPLLQTVQTLDISEQGHEPNIAQDCKIRENNNRFGLPKEMTSRERKSYFQIESNSRKHQFLPEYVYTFEFYEDKLDASTFKLILPFISLDVKKYISGQPLNIMAKVINEGQNDISAEQGEYLFNFEMFNKGQLVEASSNVLAMS